MYRVQLQNFEGPLDLLLFFIKRDELDIYDIPISYITQQFLEYIQFLDELDLSIASEFIYMASLLMSIKAKMMLPREEADDEEMDEEDPRYELVQSLLEYKRYKEMGEELQEKDQIARKSYPRSYFEPDRVEPEPDGEALHEVTIIDLIAAFRHVMATERPAPTMHNVRKYETTIEKQSDYIINTIRMQGRSSFVKLCEELKSKIMVVVTFLAILELIKEKSLVLFMGEASTDFYIDLPTTADIGIE